MQVRDAAEEDLPAILEILNREIAEGLAHFGTEPMTLEDIQRDWASRGRHPWVVALIDGIVVGFAKASEWKSRGAYAWSTEVGVYVLPEAQGRGVGRAIYSKFIPKLRDAGFHLAIGGIGLPNEPSIRLHESFGFRYAGTLGEVGWKLGGWRDVGYWTLVLGSAEPE